MTTLKRFNWLLLALLSVIERSSSMKVVGRAGENITLPCKYDIEINRARSACWGRGSIPLSGCNNQIISTDGRKVIESTRVSGRYQLLGRLEDGDVSLTILNTKEKDAGRYGCRVDIYGWFNDDIHHIDLVIEKDPAPQSTTSTTTKEKTSTEQTTDRQTHTTSHVTSTESLPTSRPVSAEAEPQQTSSSTTVVLVSVLFALIALVTAGVIIIIARRSNQLKIPQPQQVFSSVQFRSTSTTLQLQSRGSAVENIYQIDGDGDAGGDYELCP